jgi:hypothetical protein
MCDTNVTLISRYDNSASDRYYCSVDFALLGEGFAMYTRQPEMFAKGQESPPPNINP